MVQIDGAVIIVPEELKAKILREGYRCKRRNRVPCSRNRDAALHAFRRLYPDKQHAILQVIALPSGVSADEHKDGIKINTPHLPPYCISPDWYTGPASHAMGSFGSVMAGFPPPAFFAPPTRQTTYREKPSHLALADIYYTQDSIADHFQDGRKLSETKRELEAGQIKVHDIPTITVVKYKSRWLTVDNRRLCVYKRVFSGQHSIPVLCGYQDDRFRNKLKQPDGGTVVHVRGAGFW